MKETNVLMVGEDNSAGSVRSPPFELYASTEKVTFLQCGGADLPNGLSVRKYSDDSELCKVNPGSGTNNGYSVSCAGLGAHTGTVVYIYAEKSNCNGWCKLYLDVIRIEDATGNLIIRVPGYSYYFLTHYSLANSRHFRVLPSWAQFDHIRGTWQRNNEDERTID